MNDIKIDEFNIDAVEKIAELLYFQSHTIAPEKRSRAWLTISNDGKNKFRNQAKEIVAALKQRASAKESEMKEPEKTEWCKSVDKLAKKKGLKHIQCYVVTDKLNDTKSYALCNDKDWIYANQSYEAICVHIEMMAMIAKHHGASP